MKESEQAAFARLTAERDAAIHADTTIEAVWAVVEKWNGTNSKRARRLRNEIRVALMGEARR